MIVVIIRIHEQQLILLGYDDYDDELVVLIEAVVRYLLLVIRD